MEMPGAVFMTPVQFGPMIRIPAPLAAATSSRWAAAPPVPVSAKPAEITTSPSRPLAPHA